MKWKIVLLLTCLIVVLMFRFALAQKDDDDALVEYPDGSYGLDLGGGYEVTPEGEFLPDPDYRDEYVDTEYGPRTRKGFDVFPDFKWPGAGGIRPPAKAPKAPHDYYIYDEATTSPAGGGYIVEEESDEEQR
ncbi:MAG: hypothetical protein ACE5JK_07090 [Candidatus Omnitrophota bacterium]